MRKSLRLQIPEPCHENWNKMTPNEQGRFCLSCSKTVVDFSMMTDKELLDYFSTASQHICGRFSNDQLNKDIKATEHKKRFSFVYLWNLLLATLLFTETNAQVKRVKSKKTVVTDARLKHRLGEVAYVEKDQLTEVIPIQLNGHVFDLTTNEPIEGASINVKKTNKGTSADSLGNFKIIVETKEPFEIEISSVGYETQTMLVDKNTNWNNLNFLLKPKAYDLLPVEIISYGVQGKLRVSHTTGGVQKVVIDTINVKKLVAEKISSVICRISEPFKKELKIYPNPVLRGNPIQAQVALKQTGEYKMELLSAAGEVMQVQTLIVHSPEQMVAIPTKTLWSGGIYFVRITASGTKKVYQAKVLLQ